MTEINCDNCGAYSEHHSAKAVCIHCFKELERELKKKNYQYGKLSNKYKELKQQDKK